MKNNNGNKIHAYVYILKDVDDLAHSPELEIKNIQEFLTLANIVFRSDHVLLIGQCQLENDIGENL